MELKPAALHEIRDLRAAKLASYRVPLLPLFHSHLSQHAQAYRLLEGKVEAGYTLVLVEEHGSHVHRTLLETYLAPAFQDRYEDAFDLIRTQLEPRAYLVRSDECLVETSLLARGFQLELTQALMVARAIHPPAETPDLAIEALGSPHLEAAHHILLHAEGDQAPSLEQMEELVRLNHWWVLTNRDQAVGLIAHEDSPEGTYTVTEVLAPQQPGEEVLWAVLAAGKQLEREGRTPAAAVDVRNQRMIDVYRKADYFTAAAYLVFYDPLAGRPSVGLISAQEVWALHKRGEPLRIIDVLGEEHWAAGHVPGSEWIDFRSLTREARRRFAKDEPLVVYCNGLACEAGPIAADKLRQLGFTNVKDMAGGLEEWLQAGLPIET